MNGSKYALNHVCVYSSANKSIKSAKKRDIFLILHFGRQADGGLYSPPPHAGYATALSIAFQKLPKEDSTGALTNVERPWNWPFPVSEYSYAHSHVMYGPNYFITAIPLQNVINAAAKA